MTPKNPCGTVRAGAAGAMTSSTASAVVTAASGLTVRDCR
jgi:hypothetical protein